MNETDILKWLSISSLLVLGYIIVMVLSERNSEMIRCCYEVIKCCFEPTKRVCEEGVICLN